ncbi:MAG: ABC transporter substrate binding protein [Chloroflexi bacterium]|nr:ABC transporter substrate binding protein [Chloroflexota bacterium]
MRTITLLLLTLLLPVAALANDDVPTIAFLRYGVTTHYKLTDKGVLDTLQAYGYLSEDERATLDGGSDMHGEKINLLYRDAGFDFSAASLMIEDALDEGADILLTVSTEVGSLAAQALSDLEDPPALIFAIVTSPYDSGIAQSTCIKPDYVGGTEMHFDWEKAWQVPFVQDPDLETIGFLIDANSPVAERYTSYMEGFADKIGFSLEVAAATSATDVALAAEELMSAGVDAILIMPRTSLAVGIPAIMQSAIGVPVYSPLVTDVAEGVTIGSGFEGWYREGFNAARIVIGHLRGQIDLAKTGIASTPGHVVAVNLQAAAMQELEISQAMLESAEIVIDADSDPAEVYRHPSVMTSLPEMSDEERMAEDSAFLQSLQCSDEMIAEQQAALASQE